MKRDFAGAHALVDQVRSGSGSIRRSTAVRPFARQKPDADARGHERGREERDQRQRASAST
jgi:hypothetical protein